MARITDKQVREFWLSPDFDNIVMQKLQEVQDGKTEPPISPAIIQASKDKLNDYIIINKKDQVRN